jgi:hypothetical protein
MTLAEPRDSTIAIVGDGFGSTLVYTTVVFLGFRPEQVTIYGPSDSSVGTYQQYAYNLGQTILRSESESHFLPPTGRPSPSSTPGPAEARRRCCGRCDDGTTRGLRHPGGGDHRAAPARVGRQPPAGVRIGWLQREQEPTPHFTLYDEQAGYAGRSTGINIAAVGSGTPEEVLRDHVAAAR